MGQKKDGKTKGRSKHRKKKKGIDREGKRYRREMNRGN